MAFFRITSSEASWPTRDWPSGVAVVVGIADCGLRFAHQVVRRHTIVLNGLSVRRVIFRDGEYNGAAIVHGDGLADGRIPITVLAHYGGALISLQRGGGYFGGGGRTAIVRTTSGRARHILFSTAVYSLRGYFWPCT